MSIIVGRDRALVAAVYPVAFLLFALPLVEFVLTVWPPRLSGVMWRFGTYGLLSQALMLPTLAVLVGILTARALGHVKAVLVLALAAACTAVLLAGGLAMFVLDSIQARATAVQQLQAMVAATTVRGIVGMGVYVVVWAWLAIAGLRVWRQRARRGGKRQAEQSGLLPPLSGERRSTPDQPTVSVRP